MTYALVQNKSNYDGTGDNAFITTTPDAAFTAGNAILGIISINNNSLPAISSIKNQSNTDITYTEVGTGILETDNSRGLRVFLIENCPSGITAIKATLASTPNNIGLLLVELSGIVSSSALAGYLANNPTSTPTSADGATTGNITPSGQPAALLGFCVNSAINALPNAGTGFTSFNSTWGEGGTRSRAEHKRLTSTAAVAATFSSTGGAYAIYGVVLLESTASVLTAATPSGTIGTTTTATVGFTTDTAGGSAVGIIDIPARTAGITAAQIKAGHNNLDAAPIAVLSSITPTAGANSFAGTTGLTANTGYSQAIVQTISGSDSNVLVGSFTTAVATTSVTVGFNSDASTVLASTAMKFWTKNTIDGAAIDGGSGGLSGTTDASGNITLSGLTIAAGAKYLQYQVGSDTLNVHVIPVTYA